MFHRVGSGRVGPGRGGGGGCRRRLGRVGGGGVGGGGGGGGGAVPGAGTCWALAEGSAFLEDGQDVAGRVLEPGDVRAAGPVDALGVLAEAFVLFHLDPTADEFADSRVDVVHLEVEDGEVGRGDLRLSCGRSRARWRSVVAVHI